MVSLAELHSHLCEISGDNKSESPFQCFRETLKELRKLKNSVYGFFDMAPATPEFKLLQLVQNFSGEALKGIEGLGHYGFASKAAKERLDRKFGGERRKIAIYLEELVNFRPIRSNNLKGIENFADLKDVTIINLKESGKSTKLCDESLYVKLQKMTEQILAP